MSRIGCIGLLERLATALGIDLARLLAEDAIDTHNIERMMSHCAVCDAAEQCARRLHIAGLDEPLLHCANRKTLLYLRDHEHARDRRTGTVCGRIRGVQAAIPPESGR